MKHVLGINERVIAKPPGEIICYGLGSCIGLFLFDKFKKVGAGIHIARTEEVIKNSAVIEMINVMESMGSNILTMRAKIVGGASVFSSNNFEIGKKNTEEIKALLKATRIMLIADETLGNESRTARFDLETGEIKIKKPLSKTYKI